MATPVVVRDASIVTSRPVVPGPIVTPSQPNALTSGTQLDRAAEWGPYNRPIKRGRYGKPLFAANSDFNDGAETGAPWPGLIASFKIFTAFRPNALREIAVKTLPGNYGAITSIANFGFRHQIYPVGNPWTSQAGYPGPVPSAVRPMWNNVVAIVWRLRVVNPTAGGSLGGTVQPAYTLQSYNNPTAFTPAGTPTLSYK
jgi:hypothetical protein